jgi:hypothetical protein
MRISDDEGVSKDGGLDFEKFPILLFHHLDTHDHRDGFQDSRKTCFAFELEFQG